MIRRCTTFALFALLLSGCTHGFSLFDLRVSLDDPGTVGLTEKSRTATGDEGYVEPGGTLVLDLRTPFELPDGPTMLVARFDRTVSGVDVEARAADGAVVASAGVDDGDRRSGATGSPGAVGVSLPSDAEVASIAVSLHAGASSAARLVGLEIRAALTGAGTLHTADVAPAGDYLYTSPGVVLSAWGGDAGRWALDRSNAAAWPAEAPIEVRYHYRPTDPSVSEPGRAFIAVRSGEGSASSPGSRLQLDLRPGSHRVVLYPEVDGLSGNLLSVESDPSLAIDWIGPIAPPASPLDGVPADLGTLLRYPTSLWRNPKYEIYEWTLILGVLVFDSISYDEQARFFKRLAFFVEKTGFRGRLLSDEELAGRHGYNAHDYSGEGLAEFFEAAREQGTALTDEEILLRSVVLRHGIVREEAGRYVAGNGAVLGISQESAAVPTLRELLLSHESYHGVYFTTPEYVSASDAVWYSLDEGERRYWTLLLGGMQYDVTDDYLVRNEFQAYLMQQPISSAREYFESVAAQRIERWYPAQQAWVQEFLRTHSGAFREQATRVQAALFASAGLVARDVFDLEPVN